MTAEVPSDPVAISKLRGRCTAGSRRRVWWKQFPARVQRDIEVIDDWQWNAKSCDASKTIERNTVVSLHARASATFRKGKRKPKAGIDSVKGISWPSRPTREVSGKPPSLLPHTPVRHSTEEAAAEPAATVPAVGSGPRWAIPGDLA